MPVKLFLFGFQELLAPSNEETIVERYKRQKDAWKDEISTDRANQTVRLSVSDLNKMDYLQNVSFHLISEFSNWTNYTEFQSYQFLAERFAVKLEMVTDVSFLTRAPQKTRAAAFVKFQHYLIQIKLRTELRWYLHHSKQFLEG